MSSDELREGEAIVARVRLRTGSVVEPYVAAGEAGTFVKLARVGGFLRAVVLFPRTIQLRPEKPGGPLRFQCKPEDIMRRNGRRCDR